MPIVREVCWTPPAERFDNALQGHLVDAVADGQTDTPDARLHRNGR